jgi:hypothetical protein
MPSASIVSPPCPRARNGARVLHGLSDPGEEHHRHCGPAQPLDFALSRDGSADPNAPVQLDSFIVAASRDMTAAALAVNEQRFAQNIKTVLSTDTFGDIADGNVGEFVKFLPGREPRFQRRACELDFHRRHAARGNADHDRR